MLPNSTAPPDGHQLQLIKKNYRFRPNGMLHPVLVFHNLRQPINRYDLAPASVCVNPAIAIGDVVQVQMSKYPTVFDTIDIVNRQNTYEEHLHPYRCPVCQSELIAVELPEPDDFGRTVSLQCISRGCKATVMHQLVKMCVLFGMQFLQTNYLIYSTLLSVGNINAVTDLLYINEDTILQLENPQITKKYASEFVSYINRFRRQNDRFKILSFFDIPGLNTDLIPDLLNIRDREEFANTIISSSGTIHHARKYCNDITCQSLHDHYINFFDYGFNADIFRALINWK